jgi:hypothetical protein
VPLHYVDERWDREALFASRNLESLESAADQLRVTTHTIQKTAGRAQGAFLLWIFGSADPALPKDDNAYVDMGPSPGPKLPHAWQGHSAEELLGEARQRLADPDGLEGLNPGTT